MTKACLMLVFNELPKLFSNFTFPLWLELEGFNRTVVHICMPKTVKIQT